MTPEDATELLPSQRAKTVAAVKPLVPPSPDFVEKSCQGSRVARDSIVGVMPAKLLIQLLLLLLNRQMPVCLTPRVNAPHCSAEAVGGCLLLDDPVTALGTCPVMGEAQQVMAVAGGEYA